MCIRDRRLTVGNTPHRKMPLTGATDRRTFMEQEHNPNKNAELAMEQNLSLIHI